MARHPTNKLTTSEGYLVDIDILLVPAIKALWKAGITTRMCCQNNPQREQNNELYLNTDNRTGKSYIVTPFTMSLPTIRQILTNIGHTGIVTPNDVYPLRFNRPEWLSKQKDWWVYSTLPEGV